MPISKKCLMFTQGLCHALKWWLRKTLLKLNTLICKVIRCNHLSPTLGVEVLFYSIFKAVTLNMLSPKCLKIKKYCLICNEKCYFIQSVLSLWSISINKADDGFLKTKRSTKLCVENWKMVSCRVRRVPKFLYLFK